MNSKFNVSVIIPTYNSENYIVDCLKSLMSIEKKRIELIIVDGSSIDGTLKEISKFKRYFNLKICSEPDKGIYDAMNKGISMASGEFIYFLGSDDKVVKDFGSIIKLLKEKSTIYYGDVLFNGEKNYGGKFTLSRLLKENIPHQGIFYPRTVLLKTKFKTEYKLLADYHLNITLWGKRYKFEYINSVVAIYNLGGLSSNNKDRVFRNHLPWIILRRLGLKALIIKIYYYLNEKNYRKLFSSISSN